MSDLDITGRVVFDASQAESALDKIGGKADKMAREVSGAATTAGNAVDKIGDGAAGSAEKFTRAEGRIADSIKRTQTSLELLGKTASEKLEFRINSQGLDAAKFEPALAKLRETEAAALRAGTAVNSSLNRIGVSAGQTKAALSQLPAQFTDIVTSLQGGQKPLTVLIQQGGQIKDSFGGAGNAIKAMGGYVLGLVNPFTIAAAAVGGLGLAYYKGADEADEFSKAVIQTNSAAGISAIGLTNMAQSLTKIGATQGAASGALLEFVKAGNVGADSLEKFTASAIRLESVGGAAVADTAKQFAELGKDPLKASLKLNESTGFLTQALYEQIKALQERGDVIGAAKLAQEELAKSNDAMTEAMLADLGTLEKAWIAIRTEVYKMGDAIKSIGRDKSLADLAAQLSNAYASGASKAETDNLEAQYAALKKIADTQNGIAREKAKQAESTRLYIEFDKQGDEFKTKAAKREEAITKARAEGQRLIVDGLITEKDLRERISNINKKYEDKTSENAAKKSQSEYDRLIASIKTKIELNKEEIAGNAKLNEADKLRIALTEELAQGSKKMTAARIADAQAQLKQLDISERAKAVYLAQKKFEQERDKENAGIASDIAKIEAKALALEDEAKAYGLTAEALQALTIARLQERKAIISGFDPTADRISQIDSEIAALKRLGEAGSAIAGVKLARSSDDILRDANAQAAIYADETRLAGLTALERSKITAQRKVEYDYAKKLADIDKSGATDAAKESARLKLNEAKLIESSAAVNKVVQDDWQKTADSINNSITDALMRGFESGKDFAENLRDTVVNMFKTMVLRPVISAIVSPLAGALASTGASSAVAGQAAGTGGLGDLFQAKSLYDTFSGGFTALGTSFSTMAASMGKWLVQNTTGVLQQAGSKLYAYSGSIGSAGALVAGGLAGYGLGNAISGGRSVFGDGNSDVTNIGGTAIGAFLGGPIGAAIGGAVGGLINRAFGQGSKEINASGVQGTFSGDSFSGQSFQEWSRSGGWFSSGSSGTDYSALDSGYASNLGKVYASITSSTADLAAALGQPTSQILGYVKSIRLDSSQLTEAGITEVFNGIADELARTVISSKYIQESERASIALSRMVTSLAAVNGAFDVLDKTLLSASLVGGDSASKLIDLLGGIDSFNAKTLSYYETFYSEAERNAKTSQQLAEQFAALGVEVPDSLQAYRDLVNAQDVTTESGRDMYASLIDLSGAFAQVTTAAADAAASLIKTASYVTYADYAIAASKAGGTPTPRFANGGYHSGGLRLVGENGPELEVTGPSRILNDGQIRNALSGDDSTTAAIQALREDNRAQARSIAVLTSRMVKIFDAWDINGLPEVRTV
jgi:phage-related minor tail protein